MPSSELIRFGTKTRYDFTLMGFYRQRFGTSAIAGFEQKVSFECDRFDLEQLEIYARWVRERVRA